jgi:hypothetical protein
LSSGCDGDNDGCEDEHVGAVDFAFLFHSFASIRLVPRAVVSLDSVALFATLMKFDVVVVYLP